MKSLLSLKKLEKYIFLKVIKTTNLHKAGKIKSKLRFDRLKILDFFLPVDPPVDFGLKFTGPQAHGV